MGDKKMEDKKWKKKMEDKKWKKIYFKIIF